MASDDSAHPHFPHTKSASAAATPQHHFQHHLQSWGEIGFRHFLAGRLPFYRVEKGDPECIGSAAWAASLLPHQQHLRMGYLERPARHQKPPLKYRFRMYGDPWMVAAGIARYEKRRGKAAAAHVSPSLATPTSALAPATASAPAMTPIPAHAPATASATTTTIPDPMHPLSPEGVEGRQGFHVETAAPALPAWASTLESRLQKKWEALAEKYGGFSHSSEDMTDTVGENVRDAHNVTSKHHPPRESMALWQAFEDRFTQLVDSQRFAEARTWLRRQDDPGAWPTDACMVFLQQCTSADWRQSLLDDIAARTDLAPGAKQQAQADLDALIDDVTQVFGRHT